MRKQRAGAKINLLLVAASDFREDFFARCDVFIQVGSLTFNLIKHSGAFCCRVEVEDIAVGRRFKDVRRRGPTKGPIPVCFPTAAVRVVIQTNSVRR